MATNTTTAEKPKTTSAPAGPSLLDRLMGARRQTEEALAQIGNAITTKSDLHHPEWQFTLKTHGEAIRTGERLGQEFVEKYATEGDLTFLGETPPDLLSERRLDETEPYLARCGTLIRRHFPSADSVEGSYWIQLGFWIAVERAWRSVARKLPPR